MIDFHTKTVGVIYLVGIAVFRNSPTIGASHVVRFVTAI